MIRNSFVKVYINIYIYIYIYIFEFHSTDENGNLSNFVTTILLKFWYVELPNKKESDFQQGGRKIWEAKKKISWQSRKEKQAVKTRYCDKSKSIRQKKQTFKITYQKAKYQKNRDVQLAYKSVDTQKIQKIHFLKKISYKFQEKKKKVISLRVLFNKLNKAPITFAQYAIEASINAVSNFLNMKKIKLLLQTCII